MNNIPPEVGDIWSFTNLHAVETSYWMVYKKDKSSIWIDRIGHLQEFKTGYDLDTFFRSSKLWKLVLRPQTS